MAPLAIDLCCGLGGWTEGLIAEGWDVVGFDVTAHAYGEHRYPAQLVLQDIRTLHGSQFRSASLIVASPPCQEYSYRAMPWSRARSLPPPSNELFDACFRLQREASQAAGSHIPLVVENVRGAQRWVGRARWRYGSYYLWGDVPALMPIVRSHAKSPGQNWSRFKKTGEVSPHWNISGIKHSASGCAWFDTGPASLSSKSSKRRAASALIAMIPMDLARHIARVYHPANGPAAERAIELHKGTEVRVVTK